MDGQKLFDKYTSHFTDPDLNSVKREYARLLLTIRMGIGDDIYILLEEAEKKKKKLGLTPEPTEYLRDEITIEDVIFI